MTPDDPRHGTNAGRVAGCMCDPCRTAARREHKRRAMFRMNVGPLVVGTERVIAHVDKCLAWGMHYETFGVSNVGRIHRGDREVIHRRTEARILRVQPQPGVNCWPAFSAVRRLRALVAIGHPQRALAEALGVQPSYFSMLINDVRGLRRLDPDNWLRIATLYDELAMTPGVSTQSRDRAASRGWAPPLAWDNIDDPAARSVGVAAVAAHRARGNNDVDERIVERFLAGDRRLQTTKAEKVEILRRWRASGRSERSLCIAVGWKEGRYSTPTESEVA